MNDPIHNFTLRYHCIGGGHGVDRPDRRHSVYADRRRFNRVYRDFLRTIQKEEEVLTRPLSFQLAGTQNLQLLLWGNLNYIWRYLT